MGPQPSHVDILSVVAGYSKSDEVGRMLWNGVRFRSSPGLAYVAPRVPEPPALPLDGAAARHAFVESINELRTGAGLEPVALEEDQSAVIGRAAPLLRHAWEAGDYPLADDLIRGMKAGWLVDGDIVDADCAHAFVQRTDPRDALELFSMLAALREVIFQPHARAIALNWEWLGEERGTMNAFLMTYKFLPPEHYNKMVNRVYARINELRATYGRKPAKRLVELQADMKEIAESVTRRRRTPTKGRVAVGNLGFGKFSGQWWYGDFWTRDIASTSFDSGMLKKENLEIAVGVAIHREPGDPWVRYHVYYFYLD